MKFAGIIAIYLLLSPVLHSKTETQQTICYKLIQKTNDIPGNVDSTEVSRLPEYLKALAALYSSVGGSMCNGETCELTTALGLGKQGSDLQKSLLKKYFPNDKIAELVLKQDCYLRPSGASSFSDFQYITITQQGEKVTVDYNLYYYSRGKTGYTRGPDSYLYKDHVFKKLKRNLWHSIDK